MIHRTVTRTTPRLSLERELLERELLESGGTPLEYDLLTSLLKSNLPVSIPPILVLHRYTGWTG